MIDPPNACADARARPGAQASTGAPDSREVASAFERGEYVEDGMPPIIAQLVSMGYDEVRVVQAYTVFGDDHASLLTYLTMDGVTTDSQGRTGWP